MGAVTSTVSPVVSSSVLSTLLDGNGFSPASLFAGGQQGLLLEAFDIDTLFQLSAGTTPVTASGQPVGLMLGKSQGLVLSERKNLLQSTEDLSRTVWAKPAGTTVTLNTDTAPDGAETADTLNSTGNQIKQILTVPNTGDFVVSTYIKKTTSATTYPMVSFTDGSLFAQVVLNTNTGVASIVSGVSGAENIAVASDGDYWRLSFSGDFTSTSLVLDIYAAGSTNGTSYSLNTGSAVFWGAQIEQGTVATAYQRITNGGVADLTSGNHATQATGARRLIYQTGPARATLNKVDDRLSVTVPTGGFTGTMVLGTDQGTASYGVTIPAGAYDIGGRGGLYFPGNAIVGQLIRDGALSAGEAAATEAYFVANGATAGYGAVTNFFSYWRGWAELTSFPLIDTSSGTDFGQTWFGCSSLTSFPLIDTSAGANFSLAWANCSRLTSFPLIDTSAGANFGQTWDGCSSLTSFPANIFDSVKGGDFTDAFTNTALTQTSIDNILVSLVASGIAAGTRVFSQSGGSAPSSTGEAAIDTLRSRGWTVTVTGGY